MTSEPLGNSLGNLLAVPFDGRIVPHDDDPLSRYSDFNGKPTVLYRGPMQACAMRSGSSSISAARAFFAAA